MKKTYFSIFLFLLIIGNTVKSQVSSWDTLSFHPLKAKADYDKNFNPVDFNPAILKSCVLDFVNYIRTTNPSGGKAGTLYIETILDSAAILQADYMAYTESKTLENKGMYSTTVRRVKVFGGTSFVDEVVSRTKASDPQKKYSYFDLVKSMLLPVLNNKKSSQILLDRRFSKVGIAYAFDENKRNIYFSIVLGNDRTLNPSVKRRDDLTTKFTTKKYGLKPADKRKCKRCEAQRNLESWHEGLKVENGEIIFEFENSRNLRRVVGRKKDGLAVDIVMREQYKCGDDNIVDNNRVNRGVMIKRIYAKKIIKNNQITEKKSKRLKISFGEIPPEVTGDYELNLIVIKEKSVCRSLQKIYIENSPVDYVEKLRFMPDLKSIACGEYIPVAENGILEFIVPFQQSKADYKNEDIEPFIKALKEPKFDVDSLVITAFTSMEGSDKTNETLQVQRAESIVKAINQRQKQKIKYKTLASDSWEMFKRDVKDSKYPEMANLSIDEVKNQLKGKVLKDLEPILAKHRFAQIVMNITYDITGKNEQEFVINKFNKAIAAGDLKLAFSVQKYIIRACEEGRYSQKVVKDMVIPQEKKFVPFLVNYYYLDNFFLENVNDKMCDGVSKLIKMDDKNDFALFDRSVCEVMNVEFKNEADIKAMQANVDKIYTLKQIPKTKSDALNMELQFKILEFADTSASPSMEILIESTYNKIQTIVNIDATSWLNAYKLATVFIKHGDYTYAEYLMAPFINKKDISPDFVFTYFTLWSYREELYLSNTFAELAKRCHDIDKARFCTSMNKFSFQVLENQAVKKLYCTECK